MVLALAQAESVHYPRSTQHQPDTMIRGLPAENTFRAKLAPLVWLEAYATTFRYPRTKGGITDPPPIEKLTETIAAIGVVLDDLVRYFEVSMDASGAVAGQVTPPR